MTTREQSRRGTGGRRRNIPADSVLAFNRYEPSAGPPPSVQSAVRRAPPRKRESFVEANARFALNPKAAREQNSSALQWDAVDLVFIERECTTDHSHECPICLHNLSAPKITPCGHTFCHVCLLQFVAHSYDNPADAQLENRDANIKCPLCNAFFTLGTLKNVAFRDVLPVQVGVPYEFIRVSITNDTVSPCVADDASVVQNQLPLDVTNETTLFSRFCYADRFYISNILANMARDLREQLVQDPSLKRYVDVASKDVKKTKQHIVRSYRRDKSHTTPEPANNLSNPGAIQQPKPRQSRLVFQAADARNAFLHPVNHRCLDHEFDNDMEKSSCNIKGNVLEVERYTMTDILRKRYRFLRHLPNGCEFMLVELDLNGIVSQKTLAHFSKEIKARKDARWKKKVKSKREDEGAIKHRDKQIYDYFRLDRVRARPSAPMHDETTFPSLGGSPPDARNIRIEGESEGAVPIIGNAPNAAWGPDVSSYSGVTSSMGLFPALHSAINGNNQVTEIAHSPPRGAWATSPTNALALSPASGTPRRGRIRYTTLSSNAGRTHRR